MPRQADRHELAAANYASLAAGDVWPKHSAIVQDFGRLPRWSSTALRFWPQEPPMAVRPAKTDQPERGRTVTSGTTPSGGVASTCAITPATVDGRRWSSATYGAPSNACRARCMSVAVRPGYTVV